MSGSKSGLGTILMAIAMLTVTGCKTGEGGTCAKPEDCGSGLRCGKYETCVTPKVEECQGNQTCVLVAGDYSFKDIEAYTERAVEVLKSNSGSPPEAALRLLEFNAMTAPERESLRRNYIQFRDKLTARQQDKFRFQLVLAASDASMAIGNLRKTNPELFSSVVQTEIVELTLYDLWKSEK
jgi:hypothetical protein